MPLSKHLCGFKFCSKTTQIVAFKFRASTRSMLFTIWKTQHSGLTAVTMSIVICLTLLLAWTSQCATLSLKASTNTLSRSGTSNFTLTCIIDDRGNKSTSDDGLEEINRMRIVKRGNNRWNTVVEMSPEWKDPKVADDSDGQLTAESGQSYLQATWAMASYDIFGRYICDVLGYSRNGDIVSQRTPSVYIDSEAPLSLFELFTMVQKNNQITQKALRSLNENKDRIKTITSSREIDQRKLETSFKTNTKMLSDIMENKHLIQKMNSSQEMFQQKLEASDKANQKMLSDIKDNKNFIEKMNSTQEIFQTKLRASNKTNNKMLSDIKENFIQKMNSTQEIFQTKLEASNKTTQKMLRDVMENKDLILEMNSTQETLQKTVEASYKTNKKVLSDVMKNKQSIANMNSTHEIFLKHSKNTNITLESLLQDMFMLKLEISKDTNEKALEDDIARNKERIVKMHFSQETIKNKLENLIQEYRNVWPQGSYALIEPETGCPADTGVHWKRGYRKHCTQKYKSNDHVSTPAHMKKPVLQKENPYTYVTQHHCSVVEPSPGRAWPAGSYCVMKYRNLTCPVGFQEGLIIYDEYDSNIASVSGYHALVFTKLDSYIRYCCRNDSLPNEAIHLPTTKPFYLHRYGGTCQQVKDMQVTEEFIFLDTVNTESKFVDYAPDGAASLPDVKLQLCYYKPS